MELETARSDSYAPPISVCEPCTTTTTAIYSAFQTIKIANTLLHFSRTPRTTPLAALTLTFHLRVFPFLCVLLLRIFLCVASSRLPVLSPRQPLPFIRFSLLFFGAQPFNGPLLTMNKFIGSQINLPFLRRNFFSAIFSDGSCYASRWGRGARTNFETVFLPFFLI